MSTYVVFEHASQRAHRAVAQSEHACVAVTPPSLLPPPSSPGPGPVASLPPPSFDEPGLLAEEPPHATSAHAMKGKPRPTMVLMTPSIATSVPPGAALIQAVSQ
jgi:hypothetical protein